MAFSAECPKDFRALLKTIVARGNNSGDISVTKWIDGGYPNVVSTQSFLVNPDVSGGLRNMKQRVCFPYKTSC